MNELILYQPPTRPWNTPNLSPFCTKLECYLRMAEIPYKPAAMQIGKSPKGKIPYVVLGDGTRMGDSQLIVEHLERALAAEGKPALDDGLSARDRAIGHLTRRTLDEAFYFVTLYLRWNVDDAFAALREEFKKLVPGLLVPLIRRDTRKKLQTQGTGRHSPEEVIAFGAADLESCAELLGDQPFLLGDRPRTVDCTLFACLEGLLGFPVDSPLKARIAARPNLVDYRRRIRERWWKDLERA
ncbi:MAG TPA: glutathione S-transferase family protein [Kofleriaceae bacterium]|jgi:glutathione S-transferase|nr:glutathione S-transferase family protein [Kofleriaceae bacterium]